VQDYQAIYEATAELSRLLLEEDELEVFLQGIASLAVAVIPACEEAGVTLERDGQITVRTTTGTTAETVDAYQYEIDEGPCVAAGDLKHPVLIENMAAEDRWPRFASFAATQGVKSSYSLPMTLGGEVIGVLNLYSVDDSFGADDEAIGARFAEQATIAVRHATAFAKTKDMIENLHRALESRDIIGAAVGILMHRDRTSIDDAFTRLKEISQQENLKLREVAEQIIGQFRKDPIADVNA
jgi:GAF domain-containing protein